MNDFLARLKKEYTDLEERRNKLSSFMEEDKFLELPITQRHLLRVQHSAMETYLECLYVRLYDLDAL